MGARHTAVAVAKRIGLSVGMTAGIFVSLELILAACGVRPVAWSEDPYVGFSFVLPLFVEQRDADGRAVMVTAPNKLRYFNPQQFPKDKAPGTFRMFCMGGSTTYGHPYDDRTSFCGWLREFLPAADPSRRWELINAGGISYASYRVALLMEELVRYQPDLFVVYMGHNEFLERRTYATLASQPRALRNTMARLSRTRTYSVIARSVRRLASRPAAGAEGRDQLPAEVDTVLENTIGPTAYTRDDPAQREVIEHFRFNLSRMVDIAASVGAQVIFVTPASNIRDCAPFKSEHRAGLSADDERRFAALLEQAAQDRNAGRLAEALGCCDEALALDDRYADAIYLRGRTLDGLGRYDEARRAFTRARDEDICPLRALSLVVESVRETAAARRVPLVDFVALVEQRSPQGIPGQDLFLDHVHPTIEGNRMLALALLDEIERAGIVHKAASWNEITIRGIVERVEGGLDARAQGIALRNLAKVLGWAGRFEEADRLILLAVALCPDDADTQETLGTIFLRQGRLDEATTALERAIVADPGLGRARFSLGLVRHQQGRIEEAAECFRRLLDLEPSHAEARRKLAGCLSELGRPDAAADEYRRLLALRPRDVDAQVGLALALIASGHQAEATASLGEALRLDAHCAQAHYNLAVVLMKAGATASAAEHYRAAIAADPGYVSAYKNLGGLYVMQGDLARAAACFESALRLKPDDQGASNNLAAVRAARKQP